MSTIAPGLNFRIGADVKGINKAIREAEKQRMIAALNRAKGVDFFADESIPKAEA